MLTPKQIIANAKPLITFVREYTDKNGCAPSYQEIMGATGMRSKSRVHEIVKKLVNFGIMKQKRGKNRSLKLVEAENVS